MSIRGLLFLLFLYVLLVWLIVFYLFNGAAFEEIARRGVLWSAIGVGALMVWLIGERVVAWRRSRAAIPIKPKAQQLSALPVHEDDVAFARLIAEADECLRRAPGSGRGTVRDFPICLVIGAGGAGKTSLIRNSGIDSRLLAGQVTGSGGQATSTQVANIWLANETVFIEIGARILQSDSARFAEFLRVLGPPRQTRRWRRWLQELRSGFRMPALRGVILCRDVRTCMSVAKGQPLTQDGPTTRERIFAIATVFGIRCPVYAVFTNADAIPYFEEFFARFPSRDEGQIWGILAKPEESAGVPETGVWAEVETKRLNRDFGALFSRLSERRLIALNAEPLADRKPAIYEFPREFKRIRGALVQFLVDLTRPDPVALSPLARGFFFTGVRRLERGARGSPEAGPWTDSTKIGGADPTVIFRPDATQFLNAPPQGRGDLVDHWMFTRDIFQEVLNKDRPTVQTQAVAQPRRERRLPVLVWGAVAFASLMTLIWAVSWNENRQLINRVQDTTEAFRGGGFGLSSLRALDNLRDLLQSELDQSGRWRMHWGLYVGDRLRERARTLYFEGLRHTLLAQANIRLGERLDHVETSRSNDPVYEWLKTYLTTTSVGCSVDPPGIKKTLLDVIAENHPDLDESGKVLVTRQIDYYVSVLPQGLPVMLPANPDSIRRAREHIKNQHGPQQVYEKLINEVKNGPVALSLRDEIGEYESVLDAPREIPFEFSIKGRDKFEQLAGANKLPRGDTCVLGSSEGEKTIADSDQIRQARTIYYQHYRDAWKDFLTGTKVKPFRLDEAAKRLDKLSDPTTSPLLGLIRLVSRNTYFAPSKPANSGLLDPVLPASIKQKRDQAAAKIAEANRPEFGPLEVSQIFQPPQWVVPPDSQSIHSEKNKPYIDALRNLGENADLYVRGALSEQAQKLPILQDALKQAKGAQRSLADGFNNNTEGIDTQLARILLQPIQFVGDSVPSRLTDPLETKAGAGLKALCIQLLPLLKEYPFTQTAKDAGLQEVQTAFTPKTGSIWQFQQSLGDLVTKGADGVWVQGGNAKLKASSELLVFLNRAQQVSEAFFPEGKLGFHYSLRPVPGQRFVSLTIDGKTLDSSKTALQTPFSWPATSEQQAGAVGISFTPEHQTESPFGKYGGWWGVFHLFRWADDREMARLSATVTWSELQGQGGQPQQVKPPVRVDVVDFPNGIDVFNPRFFTPNLGCPGRAVELQ